MKNMKAFIATALAAMMLFPLVSCEMEIDSSTNSSITSVGTSDEESSTVPVNDITSLSITNKEELQAEWRVDQEVRVISVEIEPETLDFETELEYERITITSSNVNVVKVSGTTLSAVGVGSVTITVKAAEIEDSVKLTILDKVIESPILEIDETELAIIQGEELTLPNVTAKTFDGLDLDVEISDDKDSTISSGRFVSFEQGTHTLIYTVTDPRDETKTLSKVVTVDVYRKVLRDKAGVTNLFDIDDLLPNEEQTVTVKDTGEFIKQLNMEPGKLYYAEAIFQGTRANVWEGFAHTQDDINNHRWLLSNLRTNDRNHIFLDSLNWSTSEDRYMIHIDKNRDVPFSEDTTNFKYAIARDGDLMYAFVNDVYIASYTSKFYREIDTVPALFTNCYGDASVAENGEDIFNIKYFSGDEARDKINYLIGVSLIRSYVPDTWAELSKNIDNRNFTVNEYSEDRGMNFDFTNNTTNWNDGMVSPYIYFADNFTFEFDYKLVSIGGDYGDVTRMWLELRPWNWSDEYLHLGAAFKDRPRYLMNHLDTVEEEKWFEPSYDYFDDSLGIRYKLQRELTDTASIFTMTITSIANPEQTETRVISCKHNRWNQEVLVLWHNVGSAGEFSNIKWSFD